MVVVPLTYKNITYHHTFKKKKIFGEPCTMTLNCMKHIVIYPKLIAYLTIIIKFYLFWFINYNTITNYIPIIHELSNFDHVLGVFRSESLLGIEPMNLMLIVYHTIHYNTTAFDGAGDWGERTQYETSLLTSDLQTICLHRWPWLFWSHKITRYVETYLVLYSLP